MKQTRRMFLKASGCTLATGSSIASRVLADEEKSKSSIPSLAGEVGIVAACPDTGNWSSNEIRYAGLEKTIPIAVTCDFKARELGPDGEHETYDLKRCFTIGWNAGFRGPWCLEHAHKDTKRLLRELVMLRKMIQQWTEEMSS